VTVGDRYITPYERELVLKQKSEVKGMNLPPNENVYKPAGNLQRRPKSAYIHKSDYTHKKKKRRVNRDTGKVITGPINFLTNPAKKGKMLSTPGTLFKNPEWVRDPYERKSKFEA